MPLSARNQIQGTVTAISQDDIMAELTVDVGATAPIVSVITRASADRLNLAVGKQVTVVIKSTDVMLSTES